MKTYITELEISKKMNPKEFERIVKTGDRKEWKRLANKFVDYVKEVLSWERNEEEHYWTVQYHI